MSAETGAAEHAEHAHVHTPPSGFVWKYIFSTDHKVIGIQYWILAIVAALVGVSLSVWFRFHLAYPDSGFMSPEQYLAVVTMHGTILVFMVLTTAPLGGFGNYFLPIQLGADDMAFPRLNMLSFWLTFVSFLTLISALFVEAGAEQWIPGPGSGWTGYPPLSAVPGAQGGGSGGWPQSLWILSIAVFCLASLVGAVNFIVTTLDLRVKGMTLMRMPLTVWAWFVTSILALLSFSVLFAAGLLLLLDRHLGTSFFVPENLLIGGTIPNHKGGSPILFQHLFWFFGHPEVYIAILPGMGIASHILANFSRKPIFGYKAMVYAIFAIGVIGFFVWGHHMFQSGMSPYTAVVFSVITMVIGVPSAIKTFNWIGTMWGGSLRFTTAMLFAVGFVSLFVTGGLGGIFLGQNAADIYFHDTYFVVGHFHLIMGVAAIFSMFAGTYYWFPKMFGRMLNEGLGKIHFWTTFFGVYAIFVPMHFLGLFYAHPRRYSSGQFYEFLDATMGTHKHITMAAAFTATVQLIFIFNLIWSYFAGKKAENNPWEGTSVEWSVSSPPPFDNFDGKPPIVSHGPYEYGVPGAEKDFIMQSDPPEARPAGAPAH